MFIVPFILPKLEQYLQHLWVKDQCYEFYVQQRRLKCCHKELMDLWLLAPYCSDCMFSRTTQAGLLPDIAASNWELDILLSLGNESLVRTQKLLADNSDYSFYCKKCMHELRPWNSDDIYIVKYHLEEYYGIPLETPDKKMVSKKLRNRVFELYGNQCFSCKATNDLHIDHINPVARGGDAAFRNLQPLCKACGNIKGDTAPDVITVYNDMYFQPYPSDSYEGLFW
jgi:5-methylcytosine-specific restriction endonuclease McrA